MVLVVKNLPANAGNTGDEGSIPGLGRYPRGRNGNPLQYSCPENPMDRGAWRATVHGVAKSQTRLKRLNMHKCMDCSLPGSSVHGILWARILEWVAIPFSRESSLSSPYTYTIFSLSSSNWISEKLWNYMNLFYKIPITFAKT